MESESIALPLGDTPLFIFCPEGTLNILSEFISIVKENEQLICIF